MTTESTTESLSGNGAAPVARTKRRVATASFEGSVGRITFEDSGEVVEVDAAKIAPSIVPLVTAYGAVNILQTAYSTSDTPIEAARAMAKRLLSGDWRPGLPRKKAEPEVLTQALATHLNKPTDYIEEVWLPKFCQKHNMLPGVARRKLRAMGVLAELIAKITAERAAAASAAAKKAPRSEALDLSV